MSLFSRHHMESHNVMSADSDRREPNATGADDSVEWL